MLLQKQGKKSRRRMILMVTLGVTISIIIFIFGLWGYSFSHIPDLFRLNKECQEEGYYMSEFEWKMLGGNHFLICQNHCSFNNIF